MRRFVFGAILLCLSIAGGAQSIIMRLRDGLAHHSEKDTVRVNLLNDLSLNLYRSQVYESKKLADSALSLSKALHYQKGIANAYRNQGLHFLQQGNYPQSMASAFDALNAFEDIHNDLGTAQCLLDIGVLYRVQKEWEKARQFIDKALPLCQKHHFEYELTRWYSAMAALTSDQRKFKEAREFLSAGLARIDTAKDDNPISVAPDMLIGMDIVHQGLKNYQTSTRYGYMALANALKHNNLQSAGITYINLARHYLCVDTVNEDIGRPLLEKGFELSNRLGSKRNLLAGYFAALEWKTVVGDNKGAHEYQLRYSALKDSMINAAKAFQIAEIEGRYENQRKERELRELQEAEQRSTIEKLLLTIALMGGLSIAGIAVYRHQKTKEKIRRLLDRSNEPQQKYVIVPAPVETASRDEKFLNDVIAVIENNLQDTTFDVEKMSGELGMSRAQLQRKLKTMHAPPPAEMTKDYRLDRAAELIRRRTDTITQIGYAVGFNDQSYFTKCFKKKFGLSPRGYLERIEELRGKS
jgi:AraC-like DNA-binding protein